MTETATKQTVTININLDVPVYRLRCMLVSAFEGGSNYWIARLGKRHLAKGLKPADFEEGGKCADPEDRILTGLYLIATTPGCSLEVVEYNEDEEQETIHVLDLEKCRKGLELMALKYPRHFANFMDENDDAETADVWLQCCLLGEIVYG